MDTPQKANRVDDTLRAAVAKRIGVSEFEEQFIKSFRKVFGIAPKIDEIREDNTVYAHSELWGLDGHNWLLWYSPKREWVIAEPDLFADAVRKGM